MKKVREGKDRGRKGGRETKGERDMTGREGGERMKKKKRMRGRGKDKRKKGKRKREEGARAYYARSVMDEQDRHRPAPEVSENDRQAGQLYADPNGEDESILLAPKSVVAAIVAVSPDALAGERNHSSLGRNGGGL